MSQRVRTHANPLRRFPGLEPPAWATVYAEPGHRFALDLGASTGEFLLGFARAMPDWNILGVEVRRPLVERVLDEIHEANLANAHVVYGNIAGRLADFTPTGRIDAVYILFPDPWFKKKHHKRRLLSPAFLAEAGALMRPDARIIAMSDQTELTAWMRENLEADGHFAAVTPTPLPAISAWEEHCRRTQRTYDHLEYARI
jgi:tRNA (guanine-N7-)-methyltransferase